MLRDETVSLAGSCNVMQMTPRSLKLGHCGNGAGFTLRRTGGELERIDGDVTASPMESVIRRFTTHFSFRGTPNVLSERFFLEWRGEMSMCTY